MLHEGEILTDNTKISYCEQCKKCINWGKSGKPWDNRYNKSNCSAYPYPSMKPVGVINNTHVCEFRREK